MSGPQRIQLRRTKGWRKPEGAIVVSRPSKWGNPFVIGATVHYGPAYSGRDITVRDAAHAVGLFRQWMSQSANRVSLWLDLPDLRGHDLACWCKPGDPCHADVLLELANTPAAVPSERGKG